VKSRSDCQALDQTDSLRALRNEFVLPEGLIYLDGNSLGPVSKGVKRRVNEVIDNEWAEGLVRSWNDAGWMAAPTALGDRIAPLIGARPGEVLVADTLTFLIAKLVGAALRLRPDRHVIITDEANFHSDLYILEAVARRAGRPIELRVLNRKDIPAALNADVALVELTHVDFRTGEMLDLVGITKAVHDVGALMFWDFAHSAGAVPLDVTGANVDFAAGCGYKYLNAGPGAPAFAYIRREWQSQMENPLPGWLGHARPFDFELNYEPATGMQAFVTSSPSIIAMAALDGALETWEKTTMNEIRTKSLALTDLFIELVEHRLPGVFEIVTPRDHAVRASQVALRHDEAYAIVQALIERNVVGDFRDPDICRFGFTPLYLRYVDVYEAVDVLVDVMKSEAFRDERFLVRNPVT
jgi:kynureninase